MAAIDAHGRDAGVSGPDIISDDTPQSAIRAAIAKVADRSNLILDPDLDSFYVMDALVTKLPDAITAATELRDHYSEAATAGDVSIETRAKIIADVGHFDAALDGMRASINSAANANADGTVATIVDAGDSQVHSSAVVVKARVC